MYCFGNSLNFLFIYLFYYHHDFSIIYSFTEFGNARSCALSLTYDETVCVQWAHAHEPCALSHDAIAHAREPRTELQTRKRTLMSAHEISVYIAHEQVIRKKKSAHGRSWTHMSVCEFWICYYIDTQNSKI